MINNSITKELLSFIKKYETLTNAKKFEPLRELIDENAIYWFSDGSYYGLKAIREAFERTWKVLKDEVYSIADITFLIQTETSAVYYYTFKSETKVKGINSIFKGRGTNVLSKIDGNWKIIHEHLSLEPKS